MDAQKVATMRGLLAGGVVNEIIKNYSVSELEATRMFFNSETYTIFQDEVAQLWRLSSPAIYEIFDTEQETGNPRNSVYLGGGLDV